MIQRFLGSWLVARVSPGTILAALAAARGGLVVLSMAATGGVAKWSLIALGLLNSILFPTIFSLALEGQAARPPQASGFPCMAIVGGAVIPRFTGGVAPFGVVARTPQAP